MPPHAPSLHGADADELKLILVGSVQPYVISAQQQFDPTGYNWGDVFQQYQQDMPTFEQFDPTSLQGQISALQGRQRFDPSGLQQRISELEGKSYGGPSLTDIEALIEQRLASQFPADNPYAPQGLRGGRI